MRRWIRVSLILSLLILLPLRAASAQEGGPVYVVAPNDTLTDIARRFGVSVETLIEANGISNPSLLHPGQALVIPGFEGVSGVLTTEEIAYGETLASLSLRHGVEEETLIRLNRLVSPGRLYVGQALIVPQDEANPLRQQAARTVVVREGQSLLETAVMQGKNPWLLASANQIGERLWLAPGAPLAIPEGLSAPSGLPEPVASVQVTPAPAVQGRTLHVLLQASGPVTVSGRIGQWALHFHPLAEAQQVALQGIHAMAEPGLYDLEVTLTDPLDGSVLFSFSQPVQFEEGAYLFDPPLSVPSETVDPTVTAPEEALIASIVGGDSADRLWSGPFLFPSKNTEVFPSVFGSRRSYNNTGYNHYHSGLDFYGGTGTPILAPARGRVVFAGLLAVRGNTTILDHGWGVFTGYLHQSEILVTVGDMVEPGQTIGLVGATGRVTGAHLHWEVWVGGVPVNPLEWTSTEYP